MGKSKQRSKNNVKPSNSQRSADLLTESGFSFSGFSNLSEGGFLSCLKTVDMNHVDPNFQLPLRKMNKKDSTTKYKALQEFTDLCHSSELSNVESTLPFWPRLYCSLAIDIDHKVRESAQLAHAALTKRVGKKLATYLKQLSGTWFVTQYDTYPPASSAAKNSFNSTFPPNKIVQAIIHCQDEILTYICKNITENPQSSSVKKTLTPDEMEAQHCKIIISSLHAYSFYLKKVPLDEIEKKIESHQNIIKDDKFWKLAKHKDTSVKSAFYNVLTAVMRHAYCLLINDEKKVISTIINNIDETEPPLVLSIWEAVIEAINVIENWQNLINVEKAILPKVYSLLKNSQQNCAKIVYPNFLPLLNHLMKFDIDKKILYTRFFQNMREGMHVKKLVISRSEIQIIITTFFECFKHVIHSSSNDWEMSNSLMIEQLIPVIKTILADNAMEKSTYISELANLLRYWSKNRDSSGLNCYSKLISSFWVELKNLYKQQSLDLLSSSNDFSDLLVLLKSPLINTRRSMKVSFLDNSNSEINKSKTDIVITDSDKDFLIEIDEFIISYCKSSFNEIINNPNKNNYENFVKLVVKFESKMFFKALAETYHVNADLFKFYEENIKKWMLCHKNDAKCVMPLIFIILNYVNEDDKNKIIFSLLEMDEVILFHALKCALIYNNGNNNIIKQWCHNSAITNLLIDITKQLTMSKENDCCEQSELLRIAFKMSNDGDLYISEEAIDKVLFIIYTALSNIYASLVKYLSNDTSSIMFNTEDKNINLPLESDYTSHTNLVKLAFDLLDLTLEYKKIGCESIKIFEIILMLNMNENLIDYLKMESVSWQKVLSKMIPKMSYEQLTDLVNNIASTVWKKLFNLNSTKISDSLINIASTFLKIIYENTGRNTFSKLILLFLRALNTNDWMINLYTIILSAEVMNGTLYVSSLQVEIQIWNEIFSVNIIDNVDDNVDKCLKWAIISTKILNTFCDYERTDHDSDVLDISDITICVNEIIKLGRKYIRYYKSSRLFNDASFLLNILTTEFKLNNLTSEMYSENISEVLTQIKTKTIPDCEDIKALISIRNMNSCEEEKAYFNKMMDKIVQQNSLDPSLLAQESNIFTKSWEKLILPLEFIRTIRYYINKNTNNVTTLQWDSILLSLASWQESVNQSKNHYDDFKVMTFTTAVSQLYCTVQTLMEIHEKNPFEEFPPELLDEWKNVFMDNIHTGIAKIWILYSDHFNKKTTPIIANVLLDNLGEAMRLLDKNIFFSQTQDMSISCGNLIKISTKLLQSPVLNLQLSAYHALQHVIRELVKEDKNKIEMENFDPKSLNIYKFENLLINFQNDMNVLLSDLKLCDSCNNLIEPHSDIYVSITGYLFTWTIILEMCSSADGDVRYQYAEMLRDNYFNSLMNNVFKLMPTEVIYDSKIKYHKFAETFKLPPSFSFRESWSMDKLYHMVCWIYSNCLRYLPVFVRLWWTMSDSRVSIIVQNITSSYVTPQLCDEELNNKNLGKIENIQVKVHSSTREINAIYEMSDTKLELSIILPNNYPLGLVTVSPGQSQRGNANWTNNFHKQLSLFFTHQNGSIWDGLMLWKNNLDKKFSGLEECYICYSVLNVNTYQIPKLSCKTCRKKFHNYCLYKWFNTSLNSTCPICRNNF